MTREEALHILSLDGQFSPDQVDSAVNQRRAQIEQRIASAPTEALKDKYLRQLQELDEAKAALLGSSGAQTGSPLSQTMLYDLPLANASYTRVDGSQPSPNPGVLLQPGQTLGNGRYQIEEQIGSGGMGAVYRAFDKNRDKDIAIKVLLPSLVSHGKAKERFLQEARLSSEMSHPNIVTVFDVQQDGAHTFLTMELLKGQTLRQYLNILKQRRKTMAVDEALKIIDHICQGLAYAHDKGIVHRDIKPENIWLTETGQAKVMDFGIACLLSYNQMNESQMAIGTAYYMAPEQLHGLDIDVRADQYSIAITLYEMLTSKVPAGRIESLHKIRNNISKGLSTAIDKALSANIKHRYQRIETFNQALQSKAQQQFPFNTLVLVAVIATGILAATYPQWKDKYLFRQNDTAFKTEAVKLEGEVEAHLKQIKIRQNELKASSLRKEKYFEEINRLYQKELFGENGLSKQEGQLNAAQMKIKDKLYAEAIEILKPVNLRLSRLEIMPDIIFDEIKGQDYKSPQESNSIKYDYSPQSTALIKDDVKIKKRGYITKKAKENNIENNKEKSAVDNSALLREYKSFIKEH